jgi:hypothetical protein
VHERPINYNHHIIRELSSEVIEAIKRSQYCQRFGKLAVYAGEFPTGDINALATRVPSGFLALINIGLVRFIESTVLLYIVSHRQADPLGGEILDRDVLTLMRAILLTYLAQTEPIKTEVDTSKFRCNLTQAVLYSLFKNSCLRFVLAHEFGHILAGHLDQPILLQQKIRTPVGRIEVVPKSWKQEYEADAIAIELLLHFPTIAAPSKTMADSADLLRGYSLAAPFFFFGLDLLLRRVFELLLGESESEKLDEEELNTTHPPPLKRIESLLNHSKSLLPEDDPAYGTVAQSTAWLDCLWRGLQMHSFDKA